MTTMKLHTGFGASHDAQAPRFGSLRFYKKQAECAVGSTRTGREAVQASKKPLVEAYDDGLWHPWHMLTLSLLIYHSSGFMGVTLNRIRSIAMDHTSF
eukprot:jgi/Botrbrau1/12778/Bobra.0238s0016.2